MILKCLAVLLLLPFSSFAFELSCPYGICDSIEELEDFSKLARDVHKLLKKTGFESGVPVFIGAESYADWEAKEPAFFIYDFLRTSKQTVLGKRNYYARQLVEWESDPDFDVIFSEDDDWVIPYFKRKATLNHTSDPQITSYLLNSFHESTRMISELRSDLSDSITGEIAYHELMIQDLKRDLIEICEYTSWAYPGSLYPRIRSENIKKEYEDDIHKHHQKITNLSNELSRKENLITHTENQVNGFFDRLYHYCLEQHQNIRALYELSLMDYQQGENIDAFFKLKRLINQVELEGRLEELSADLHLLDGKLCNELSQFHDAIHALRNGSWLYRWTLRIYPFNAFFSGRTCSWLMVFSNRSYTSFQGLSYRCTRMP